MLRCRETSTSGAGLGRLWRFSLEDARTGEKHAFADLHSLVAFLEAQLAASQPDGDPLPDNNPKI
jgi:hypothetical protein